MAVPRATASATAGLGHAVVDAFSTANTAAESPLTEPTERSISPSSSTNTMPTAMSPVPTMSMLRLDRLRGEERLVEAGEDDPDGGEADQDGQ